MDKFELNCATVVTCVHVGMVSKDTWMFADVRNVQLEYLLHRCRCMTFSRPSQIRLHFDSSSTHRLLLWWRGRYAFVHYLQGYRTDIKDLLECATSVESRNNNFLCYSFCLEVLRSRLLRSEGVNASSEGAHSRTSKKHSRIIMKITKLIWQFHFVCWNNLEGVVVATRLPLLCYVIWRCLQQICIAKVIWLWYFLWESG